MKVKINDNKTLKDDASKELIASLLEINFEGLRPLYKTMLIEVLINGKTFSELKETVKLTTSRQRVVFLDAVKLLKKELNRMNNILASFKTMEKELSQAQSVIEYLEGKTSKENNLTPELKNKLAIPIGKSGLSSIVQQACSLGNIHSVSDLVSFSKREFLNLRNCGKKCVDEVETYLDKNGLSWKMDL